MKILLKDAGNDRHHDVLHALYLHNPTQDEAQAMKFQKMFSSPYSFYRGTNHLFWYDFAGDWRLSKFGNENTATWLLGDAHLYNLGAYCNADNTVIFGANDFDDAIVADYQYDVWRFATSIVLAMSECNFEPRKAKASVKRFAASYLETIMRYDENPPIDVFSAQHLKGALKKFVNSVADKESRHKMLDKYTISIQETRFFDNQNPELEKLADDERESFTQAFAAYQQYLFQHNKVNSFLLQDVIRRVGVGTGSLGLTRYFALIKDTDNESIFRILDVKQIPIPTAFAHLSQIHQAEYHRNFRHEGERFVTACHSLTGEKDLYLGYLQLGEHYFSIRERSPFKKAFDITKLKTAEKWEKTAMQWGKILANTHRKAAFYYNMDRDVSIFEQEIATTVVGKEDEFVKLVAQTAMSYAEQVTCDWEYFIG